MTTVLQRKYTGNLEQLAEYVQQAAAELGAVVHLDGVDVSTPAGLELLRRDAALLTPLHYATYRYNATAAATDTELTPAQSTGVLTVRLRQSTVDIQAIEQSTVAAHRAEPQHRELDYTDTTDQPHAGSAVSVPPLDLDPVGKPLPRAARWKPDPRYSTLDLNRRRRVRLRCATGLRLQTVSPTAVTQRPATTTRQTVATQGTLDYVEWSPRRLYDAAKGAADDWRKIDPTLPYMHTQALAQRWYKNTGGAARLTSLENITALQKAAALVQELQRVDTLADRATAAERLRLEQQALELEQQLEDTLHSVTYEQAWAEDLQAVQQQIDTALEEYTAAQRAFSREWDRVVTQIRAQAPAVQQTITALSLLQERHPDQRYPNLRRLYQVLVDTPPPQENMHYTAQPDVLYTAALLQRQTWERAYTNFTKAYLAVLDTLQTVYGAQAYNKTLF